MQLLIDMVVNEMPPKRKMIYKLSRIKGLSNEQIAEKLGIQKKTVEGKREFYDGLNEKKYQEQRLGLTKRGFRI